MRVHKAIGRFLKIGTLLSTWGLIATVLLQIVCRFSPIETPVWTEEASRLFFIYAISFAAGLAMKSEYYVHLEMFYNRFAPKFQDILKLIIPLFSFLLFLVMGLFSLQFIAQGFSEKSPGMGFQMGIAFMSMGIMAVSIAYYLLRTILKLLRSR